MSPRPLWFVTIAFVLAGALARPAVAQPDKRALAKAAFQRATAAEERKDWRTAITEYLNAYDLAPHPDVLYNVAAVYERLEELRSAATYYQRYLDEAEAPPDRPKVEKLIESMRKRASVVKITTTPLGATVMIDGERRGRAPLEVRLNGGTHQIAAEQGGATATRDLTVEYAEPAEVALVLGGKGVLVVSSNEAGAQVTIDGTAVGVTPFTGQVESGRHQVVISKDTFTTVERSVEIPPDGTAQITASMVHPLGFAPPASPALSNYLVGFDGGRLFASGGRLDFAIYAGYRPASRRWDLYTGVAFGESAVGYKLGTRLFLATHTIRPYFGVGAELVSAASNVRAVGGLMIADLGKGKSQVDLYLEGGVGSATTVDGSEKFAVVTVGAAWHLNRAALADPDATGR